MKEWRIGRAEDIGEIVFDMVGIGQLGAQPEDKPSDFTGSPDLEKLLGKAG